MSTLRQLLPTLRLWIAVTLVLGLVYPLTLVAVARLMPGRADGSMLQADGTVVGSALIAQHFDQPRYFWPRPSAGGYDMLASGGSNLGPNNPDLVDAIRRRQAALAGADRASVAALPADAVTASASGRDPDISPAYAAAQVPRVAAARGIPTSRVQSVVDAHTAGRPLGFLGQPTVNVLELNIALDRLTGS